MSKIRKYFYTSHKNIRRAHTDWRRLRIMGWSYQSLAIRNSFFCGKNFIGASKQIFSSKALCRNLKIFSLTHRLTLRIALDNPCFMQLIDLTRKICECMAFFEKENLEPKICQKKNMTDTNFILLSFFG